jgi:hypothetical protein
MTRIQLACYSLVASAFLLAGMLVVQLDTPQAKAEMVISEESFAMMTATTRPQGEGLFVLDNNTGRLLIYRYNVAQDAVQPLRNVNLNRYLAGGGGGGGDRNRR